MHFIQVLVGSDDRVLIPRGTRCPGMAKLFSALVSAFDLRADQC